MIFFFFHSYLPPYSLRETLCDYMSTDLTFSPRKWQAAEGTGLVYERMAIIGVSAVCLVMSDSMWSLGLEPARLLCPWNFPGKNTAVDCHFLFQGIFPIQELNPCLLCLLHRRWILYPLSHRGSPLVNNDNGCKLVTCVHTKSLQLCQPLCDPVDCGPPGSPVRGDSPDKNTGVGCHALPQGKFTGRIQVLKNHFQCIK